ncbi:MAG: bifunctional DNA-formamidopyrimidine glycosylase/DNA-(apurinic or apyrimidinic site) lyase [Gammaproteobacteria bacterium]|jgi:formamidopyrimidine-DNA glycosylase|nr:bifunctional DNA-formamidopyrimidine glycosylase/DNA-(apurinic or apyrimidinic site) lyase [Gammaproteobacteria bacterium]
MPELPEVETTCRGIAPHLIDHKVRSLIVRETRLRWPIETKQLKKQLLDQPVLEVSRRAKYILIHFPTGVLVIHLGMSGTLKILKNKTPLLKHDHIDWILSSGYVMRYHDPRRFGAVLFTDNLKDLKQLKHLGPEPLDETFNGNYLYEKAKKHRCPVKTFIMDQKIVVGVGNIYASECLFLAKIHPSQSANTISLKRYHRLYKAIQGVLTAAIKQGGTTLKDFRKADGKPGYFSQKLNVYDRKDLPCIQCQTPIEAIKLGQRSTYFCPNCQSLSE